MDPQDDLARFELSSCIHNDTSATSLNHHSNNYFGEVEVIDLVDSPPQSKQKQKIITTKVVIKEKIVKIPSLKKPKMIKPTRQKKKKPDNDSKKTTTSMPTAKKKKSLVTTAKPRNRKMNQPGEGNVHPSQSSNRTSYDAIFEGCNVSEPFILENDDTKSKSAAFSNAAKSSTGNSSMHSNVIPTLMKSKKKTKAVKAKAKSKNTKKKENKKALKQLNATLSNGASAICLDGVLSKKPVKGTTIKKKAVLRPARERKPKNNPKKVKKTTPEQQQNVPSVTTQSAKPPTVKEAREEKAGDNKQAKKPESIALHNQTIVPTVELFRKKAVLKKAKTTKKKNCKKVSKQEIEFLIDDAKLPISELIKKPPVVKSAKLKKTSVQNITSSTLQSQTQSFSSSNMHKDRKVKEKNEHYLGRLQSPALPKTFHHNELHLGQEHSNQVQQNRQDWNNVPAEILSSHNSWQRRPIDCPTRGQSNFLHNHHHSLRRDQSKDAPANRLAFRNKSWRRQTESCPKAPNHNAARPFDRGMQVNGAAVSRDNHERFPHFPTNFRRFHHSPTYHNDRSTIRPTRDSGTYTNYRRPHHNIGPHMRESTVDIRDYSQRSQRHYDSTYPIVDHFAQDQRILFVGARDIQGNRPDQARPISVDLQRPEYIRTDYDNQRHGNQYCSIPINEKRYLQCDHTNQSRKYKLARNIQAETNLPPGLPQTFYSSSSAHHNFSNVSSFPAEKNRSQRQNGPESYLKYASQNCLKQNRGDEHNNAVEKELRCISSIMDTVFPREGKEKVEVKTKMTEQLGRPDIKDPLNAPLGEALGKGGDEIDRQFQIQEKFEKNDSKLQKESQRRKNGMGNPENEGSGQEETPSLSPCSADKPNSITRGKTSDKVSDAVFLQVNQAYMDKSNITLSNQLPKPEIKENLNQFEKSQPIGEPESEASKVQRSNATVMGKEKSARISGLEQNSSPVGSSKNVSYKVALANEERINTFCRQVHGFDSDSPDSEKSQESDKRKDSSEIVNGKDRVLKEDLSSNCLCCKDRKMDPSWENGAPQKSGYQDKVVEQKEAVIDLTQSIKDSAINGACNEFDPTSLQKSSTSRYRFRPVPKKRRTFDKDESNSVPLAASADLEKRFVFRTSNNNTAKADTEAKGMPNPASQQAPERRTHNIKDSFHGLSPDEALLEQERLFREAASRMRTQARARISIQSNVQVSMTSIYSRTFTERIANVHKVYPSHWKYTDLYARLGLPRNATDSMIRSQYRRLALVYHPDRNVGSADTKHKFQAVTEAYSALMHGY